MSSEDLGLRAELSCGDRTVTVYKDGGVLAQQAGESCIGFHTAPERLEEFFREGESKARYATISGYAYLTTASQALRSITPVEGSGLDPDKLKEATRLVGELMADVTSKL